MRSEQTRRRWTQWGAGLLALSAVALSACDKGRFPSSDPRQRLSDYISRSFSVKSEKDREELLGFLSGPSKIRLAAWSDEQFRQAFIDSKRTFGKLVYTEVKNSAPGEAQITYELTFSDQEHGTDTKVTQKRLAHLVQENGVWMIREVRNIKELVEYKNGMDVFP